MYGRSNLMYLIRATSVILVAVRNAHVIIFSREKTQMKAWNKAGLAMLAGTAMLMGLTSCTGGGPVTTTNESGDDALQSGPVEGEITFQTWSLKNDRFTPYFEKLIADFEKENPGTKIKWMDQPGDGYEDKVLQQANSGELPDVINLPPQYAYQLAKAGQLEDLAKADPEALNAYVDGVTKAYTFDDAGGGSYGYGWYLGTDVNWWNTAMLEKAGVDVSTLPETLDDMLDMAIDAAKKTNGEVKVVSDLPALATLASSGVEIMKDGKFTFATDRAREIVEKYAEAFKAGAMPAEALSGEWVGNSASYKEGKVAWTTGSGGFASELEKEAPSILEATKTTPRFGIPPLFSQALSVSANSKAKPLALKFAQYVTSNENQVEFLKIAQGFFPGTKEGNENPESFTSVIENPLQKEATEMATVSISGKTQPEQFQLTEKISNYYNQQIALAVRGDISAEEALKKAEDNANAELSN